MKHGHNIFYVDETNSAVFYIINLFTLLLRVNADCVMNNFQESDVVDVIFKKYIYIIKIISSRKRCNECNTIDKIYYYAACETTISLPIEDNW